MSATIDTTVWCGCGDAIPEDDIHCATCWVSDGPTVDRVAAVLVNQPSIIGRVKVQPREAHRIACALWDALERLPVEDRDR